MTNVAEHMKCPYRVLPNARPASKQKGEKDGNPWKRVTFKGEGYSEDVFLFGPDAGALYESFNSELRYDILQPAEVGKEGKLRWGTPVVYPANFFEKLEAMGRKQIEEASPGRRAA
jgi:hypothetical protein